MPEPDLAVRAGKVTDKILTVLGSVKDVACFLAWKDAWDALPTMDQMRQYMEKDGAYFCAIDGCEVVGKPERGRDAMVTIGPLVFCHDHGKAVVQFMRGELGVDNERFQFHYLSKTLHFAGFADDRAAEAADEDGKEKRRAKRATEEMESRWARLSEACKLAPGWIAEIAERRAEAAEEAKRRAQNPPVVQPDLPEPKSEPQDKIPSVETYKAMSDDELEAAYKAAGELKDLLPSEKDRLGPDEFNTQTKQCDEVQRRIQTARKAKALARIAELKKKLGITPPIAVSLASPVVVQVSKPTDVPKPKAPVLTVACNFAGAVTGDPSEGVAEIPRFHEPDFPDHLACDKALDATGDTWRRMLVAHADPDAKQEEVLKSDTPAYKEANRLAKNCLLHGPLTRKIGIYRGSVIRLYSETWPKQWAERLARGGNGHAAKPTGDLQCAGCGTRVRQLFPKPVMVEKEGLRVLGYEETPTVCGGCAKTAKNRLTATQRESRRTRKQEESRDFEKGKPGPNEGSGLAGHKFKKGKKDRK